MKEEIMSAYDISLWLVGKDLDFYLSTAAMMGVVLFAVFSMVVLYLRSHDRIVTTKFISFGAGVGFTPIWFFMIMALKYLLMGRPYDVIAIIVMVWIWASWFGCIIYRI